MFFGFFDESEALDRGKCQERRVGVRLELSPDPRKGGRKKEKRRRKTSKLTGQDSGRQLPLQLRVVFVPSAPFLALRLLRPGTPRARRRRSGLGGLPVDDPLQVLRPLQIFLELRGDGFLGLWVLLVLQVSGEVF